LRIDATNVCTGARSPVETGQNNRLPDPAFTVEAEIGGRKVIVKFTQHYQLRRARRGAEPEQVIACLRRPDVKGLPVDEPDPPVGRKRWGRYDESGLRRLDVVFEESEEDGTKVVSVVSVFWKSGGGI
jgi:hypothetical protein